jgi:tRNA G18 (ribose-2'-O)-methylase SpoU
MSELTGETSSTIPGPVVTVTDSSDPRLDLYRNLNDPGRRVRLESDRSVFVTEGRLAVGRLLTSQYVVRSLLVDDHQAASSKDLVVAAQARGATVFVAPRDVLADTVGFALHRGVVAIAERPAPSDSTQLLGDVNRISSSKGDSARIAILEGLNDHENLGALFRNAAAFGVGCVLLDPTCADPLYRRAIRVSVGHALHVPHARLNRWPVGLREVREAGFVVAAMSPHTTTGSSAPSISVSELKPWLLDLGRTIGVALLLGAEGPGLTQVALGESDVVVHIPMAEGVDSINVATAAAIAFSAVADL